MLFEAESNISRSRWAGSLDGHITDVRVEPGTKKPTGMFMVILKSYVCAEGVLRPKIIPSSYSQSPVELDARLVHRDSVSQTISRTMKSVGTVSSPQHIAGLELASY